MLSTQVESFIKFLEGSNQYSENTTIAYRNDLMQFVNYLSEYKNWKDLEVAKVQNYVTQLQEQGYASSTVARKVAAIKTFLGYLHQNNQTKDDISRQIITPKVRRQAQTLLNEEEVTNLLSIPEQSDSPKNLRNRVLLNLLYSTDLRITELVELHLKDYDGKKIKFTNDNGVTREFELNDSTRSHMEKYLKDGRPSLDKNLGSDALFLNHRGSALSRQGLWLIIKECAQRAGLSTAVTPHILRRSSDAHI